MASYGLYFIQEIECTSLLVIMGDSSVVTV